MPVFRIKFWNKHYENNRTRELKKMDWVPIPNRMDGDGYTELVEHADGAAHFGCWIAIVEIASRCDPRGTLLRDGAAPHTPATLARLSRLPLGTMCEALVRLMKIGWIEDITNEFNDMHEGAGKSQDDAGECGSFPSLPFSSIPSKEESEKPEIPGERIVSTAGEVGVPRKKIATPRTAESPLAKMCREWIEIYPNQVDVGRASQEWISLVKDEPHAREVLAGTKRYIESGAWRDSNGELVPNKAKNPMYFLRDGNYRDNPAPFKPRATNSRAVIDDSQLFPKVTPRPDFYNEPRPE